MGELNGNEEELLRAARERYISRTDIGVIAALENEIRQYREKIERMQAGKSATEAETQIEIKELRQDVGILEEELRHARSDIEQLKNTIVKMAMEMAGVFA